MIYLQSPATNIFLIIKNGFLFIKNVSEYQAVRQLPAGRGIRTSMQEKVVQQSRITPSVSSPINTINETPMKTLHHYKSPHECKLNLRLVNYTR